MIKISLGLAATLLGVASYYLLPHAPKGEPPVVLPAPAAPSRPAGAHEVHQFCGQCHAYPPAECFPKSLWPIEVRRAYDFFRNSKYRADALDMDAVIEYYVRRAPERLPPAEKCAAATAGLPVELRRLGWAPPSGGHPAGVLNVELARLFTDDKLDLLVCHSNPGRLWAVKPYDHPPSWHLLGEILAPCHVQVVDLDGDGIKDLLVADLGSKNPTTDSTGRVIWLRGDAGGRFTPITLLEGVGRVTDVQAADFRRNGKLDLVVAVFGWQAGAILHLENRTTDWAMPQFSRHLLDDRSGTIHVAIGDVNGDGQLDVVALLSQEHETIVAFLGDGKGGFTKKTIYEAPHPAYGSSGIQLVDLDGDGKLDVLYTNGDTLDPPYLLKPYHGIQWLHNRDKFPFTHRPITAQYGVMRAVAADVDGDGRLDIVSAAFLPPSALHEARAVGAEAVQVLRQVAPGKFERHVLATGICCHLTCAAGDLFGDGRVHIVAGNYFATPVDDPRELVTVWKNLGRVQ
jgi:hypothetical protein